MSATTFNARLLVLLRDARGVPQSALAERVGVAQGFLSLVETGQRQPSPDVVSKIADALNVPLSLLQDDTPIRMGEAQDLHFRRRKTLPVKERKALEAKAHLALVTVRGLLRGVDYEPDLAMPALDGESDVSPTDAAKYVRRLWRMPSGPVHDLTGWLEAAGMFFMPVAAPPKVDAVTRRDPDGYAVTAIKHDLPTDRDRATKAHELGHLVLHAQAMGWEIEAEADQFAAEFLTPADEIVSSLRGITTRDLDRLLDLRRVWGVSLPFLVHRAQDLNGVTDRMARSLYAMLSSRGWMRSTVLEQPLSPEQPTLLSQVISVHIEEHGYTKEQVASAAHMLPERATAHFFTGGARLRAV